MPPLEASLDYFWVSPPSHLTPQKMKDYTISFCERRNVNATVPQNALTIMSSQEENCLPEFRSF